MSGKFVDPDEFRPPKADSTTDPVKFRFFILPPIMAGEKLKSGVVGDDQGMEHFFLPHANHWINDRPHPCPRVWVGEGSGDCAICQTGFDLLKEEKDEETRKNIVRQWMPNTYYMVNIYFTNSKMNPEDLRGKVKFYNAPKTLFDVWSATLMKDDAGDPEDPEAFGVFFDENAAFLFQLEVLKHGRNNSYKTSKFVANNGEPQPMLKEESKLPTLLKLRHNLFEKVEKPDTTKIEKLARTMLDGDDLDDDGGFDEDESAEKKPKKETQKESKKESKKEEPEETDDELVGDDLVDESPIDDDDSDDESEEDAKTSDDDATNSDDSDDADDADDADDEIDDLLSQLEDDD